MRHPHHLPPNLATPAPRASNAPTMGILLPPQPLQRTCMELGVCQGDGRCGGCEPVEPPASEPEPLWARWAYAIAMAAVYGGTAGVVLGALKYLLDLVGS